ncbi:unnamed protein product [Owenia fusiformis]|uniref:Uncharacterized protein n=1 Tax=Owenia fusiformis TaxID=6347 RepID=A0A8J1XQ14_OWEFU|nr:unnamed protein product [Owenia fusiformis]
MNIVPVTTEYPTLAHASRNTPGSHHPSDIPFKIVYGKTSKAPSSEGSEEVTSYLTSAKSDTVLIKEEKVKQKPYRKYRRYIVLCCTLILSVMLAAVVLALLCLLRGNSVIEWLHYESPFIAWDRYNDTIFQTTAVPQRPANITTTIP